MLVPLYSENLVLHNLIDISNEKLKFRKKLVDQAILAQPIQAMKSSMTDTKYIYEGERETAKKSVNMLTIDKQFE